MRLWKQWVCAAALALSLGYLSTNAAAADKPASIKVESSAIEQLDQVTVKPGEQSYTPADAAELLKDVPGANVNKNGPVTGIAQYRGMFGTRVNVQVDGLNIAPAGPNWMDPPLSHLAPEQLDSIAVIRGISPVSAGAESIGGTVKARSATIPFAAGDKVETHGDITTGYESNNNAYTIGGRLGIGSNENRLQLNGDFAKGKDIRAGNSLDIVPTRYKRQNLGVDFGHRFNKGVLDLGYGHEKVDNAGSPALPMDIIYVKGNAYRLRYQSDDDFPGVHWLLDAHYMDTDHEMDNYSLRKPPAMMGMMGMPMKRFALTNAKDFAYNLQAAMPMQVGTLTLGTDAWLAKHYADVFDPTKPTFLFQNYHGIRRNRYSLFAEWKSSITDRLGMQLGVRYSRVNMHSGQVTARGFPTMLQTELNTLKNNFNNSQLSRNDNLVDLVLQLTQRMNDSLTFKIGFARKQRAPSYQERYLWAPMESTAGLADMRTYVGNVNLKPETAYDVDAGFDWQAGGMYFTLGVFYKRVKNYIQGTPLTTGPAYAFRKMQGNMMKGGGFCTANPFSPFCVPLQFSNVEAELYGADAGFGINFTDHISLDGAVSYVRGKRKDITDNLYRIAPLNSTVNLSYYGDRDWSITAQTVLYGKQNKVSRTNSEQRTSGYSVFNLQGRYAMNRNIVLSAGVNNVFDLFYQSHLGGYNRVTEDVNGKTSAVAQGARLPGQGRSFFLRVGGTF